MEKVPGRGRGVRGVEAELGQGPRVPQGGDEGAQTESLQQCPGNPQASWEPAGEGGKRAGGTGIGTWSGGLRAARSESGMS